jgi:hypothetical protein
MRFLSRGLGIGIDLFRLNLKILLLRLKLLGRFLLSHNSEIGGGVLDLGICRKYSQ